MHLLSSEEMVYETLTQITLRRSKQHLPPPWGEMGGRKARSYPQILVKNQRKKGQGTLFVVCCAE